jgi:pimeloyl-ACP methyl ester carboxylesterase
LPRLIPFGHVAKDAHMRSLALTLASVLFAAPACPAQDAPYPPGLVVLVGGVGGIDSLGMWGRVALPLADVPHELREFKWTYCTGRVLRDLQDSQHLHERALDLAREVYDWKDRHPDRPVFLIGHSGGGGVVLAAAGMLPPETLERVILLSAAVSPSYDLRPALRAARRDIVSFYSPMDWVLLGVGTSQFGTVDRVYTSAAGKCGFAIPTDLDEEGRQLYGKFSQSAWKPSMLLENRGGGHFATVAPCFLARYVAPLLR